MSYNGTLDEIRKKYGISEGSGNAPEGSRQKRSYQETLSSLIEKYSSQPVGADRFNSMISDYNRFLDETKKDYDAVEWGNAGELNEKNTARIAELGDTARELYRYYFTGEGRNEVYAAQSRGQLQEIINNLRSMGSDWKSTGDYYSQWEDEDSWNEYQKITGLQEKYNWHTAPELEAALEGMPSGEDKDYLSSLYDTLSTQQRYGGKVDQEQAREVEKALEAAQTKYFDLRNQMNVYSTGGAMADSRLKSDPYLEELQKQMEAAKADYDALTEQKDELKNREWFADKSEEYARVSQEAKSSQIPMTWEEAKSRSDELRDKWWQVEYELPEGYATEEEAYRAREDIYNQEQIARQYLRAFKTDNTYKYINNTDGFRDKANEADKKQHTAEPYKKLNFMTEDEIDTYNFIYAYQGKQAANDYLEYLSYFLDEQNQQRIAQQGSDAVSGEGVSGVLQAIGANIASVPATLASGAGLIDAALQKARNAVTGEYKPINYNTAAMTPNTFAQSVRGTTAKNITDATGTIQLDPEKTPVLASLLNGKGWADVYQLGMSMVDSTAAAGITLATGIPGTVLLGGAAGTQGMLEALDRGATDDQAITMGVLNGAFEALFEYVSLDKLINGDISKSALRQIMEQAFVEGSEEMCTTLANTFAADIPVMGDKSQLIQAMQEYRNAGLSDEEASRRAWEDWGKDFLWDGIGGFLSGGFMSGGKVAWNKLTHADYAARYGENAQELVDQALSQNPESKPAQRAQNILQNGKELSGRQIHNVLKGIETQDKAAIQAAAQNRLTELGETGDVAKLSAALAKQAAGEKLNRAERRAIQFSHYGAQVAAELDPQTKFKDNKAPDWTGKIGTSRLNTDVYNRAVETAQTPQETETAENIPVSQETRNPAQAVTADAVEPVSAEASYSVSDSGETTRISTGETVRIQEVAEAGEGGMRLRTEDGSLVNADDVGFASREDALLYESVADLGADATAANVLIRKYKDYPGDVSVEDYTAGAAAAFQAGMRSIPVSQLAQDPLASKLTGTQRNAVYAAGRNYGRRAPGTEKEGVPSFNQDQQAKTQDGKPSDNTPSAKMIPQKNVDVNAAPIKAEEKTASNPPRKAVRHASPGLDRRGGITSLSEADAKQINAISIAMGVRTVFADMGKELNGSYDADMAMVYLNKNAPDPLMTFAGHEITHRIQSLAPKAYQTFRDYVIDKLRSQQDVDKLIERYQAAYLKGTGKALSKERALDEIAAGHAESMLSDSNRYADLVNTNLTLAKRILNAIRDLISRLRQKLTGKYSYIDRLDQSERLWSKAFQKAIQSAKYVKQAEAQSNSKPSTGIQFSTNLTSYPYNMQTVIQEYIDSVDDNIKSFIQDVESGKAWSGKKVRIGDINDRMSADIEKKAGISGTSGNAIYMNTSCVEHIMKRHGSNGSANRSMSDINDIARIGYVLENYDAVDLGDVSKEFKNKDGSPSRKLLFTKKINGTYYVVEAVPDTGKAWIVSAYIDKKGASQVRDAETPRFTAKTEPAYAPTESIAEAGPGSQEKNSQASVASTENLIERSRMIDRMTERNILQSAIDEVDTGGYSADEKAALIAYKEHLTRLIETETAVAELQGKESLTQKEKNQLKILESRQERQAQGLWALSHKRVMLDISEKAKAKLVEKYGAVPEGEAPARKVSVPSRTSKDNRVSRTVRTAMEASATSDEMAEILKGNVIKGDFSYIPITDDASKQRADDEINRKGWTQAYADWNKQIAVKAPGKDAIALGFTLYNNAVNSGDHKTAVSILTEITARVREGAQMVQAVRILKQLGPESRLYGIQMQLNHLQDQLNARYGEKAPQIDMNSQLAQDYLSAKTTEEISKAEQALFRDIAGQVPNTWADKWNSLRYLSMLGNARTHIRNFFGNAAFTPVRVLKDGIAAGIESGMSAITGGKIERSKAVLNPSNASDRELYKMAKADYAEIADMITGGGKNTEAITQIERMKPAFGSKNALERGLSKISKWNSDMLDKEDVKFSKPAYAAALAGYLKANHVTAEDFTSGKTTQEFMDSARAYAVKEAQKATYRDYNAFSDWVASVGRRGDGKNAVQNVAAGLIEGVLPFRRTPANILVRGVEYSPVGLANGIKQAVFDVKSGKVTAAQAIDTIASGLTGTMLLGLGALMASGGLVHGGDDDDDKQQRFDELHGYQSYALQIGNSSYTIDWLAPEAIPFFIGVNLYESFQEQGGWTLSGVLESLSRISEPMLEMSMLSGLNDFLDNISFADNKLMAAISSAATSRLTQALPTLFGQVERVGEPIRETTFVNRNSQLTSDMQYVLAKTMNKVPGVEFQQIPYIDAWGREEELGNVASRVFGNLFSPGYGSTIHQEPFEEELQRLYDLGYDSVLPSRVSQRDKVNGKYLSAEDYVTYAKTTGQTQYDLVKAIQGSSWYNGLSDGDKASLTEKAYEYSRAIGKKTVDETYEVAKWIEEAQNSGSPAQAIYEKYMKDTAKDRYNAGQLSAGDASDVLQDFFGKDSGDAKMRVAKWDWDIRYPEYADLREAAVSRFASSGVSAKVYYDACKFLANATGDKDESGNTISGSKKEKVMKYIASLNISDSQKDSLWNAIKDNWKGSWR